MAKSPLKAASGGTSSEGEKASDNGRRLPLPFRPKSFTLEQLQEAVRRVEATRPRPFLQPRS